MYLYLPSAIITSSGVILRSSCQVQPVKQFLAEYGVKIDEEELQPYLTNHPKSRRRAAVAYVNNELSGVALLHLQKRQASLEHLVANPKVEDDLLAWAVNTCKQVQIDQLMLETAYAKKLLDKGLKEDTSLTVISGIFK